MNPQLRLQCAALCPMMATKRPDVQACQLYVGVSDGGPFRPPYHTMASASYGSHKPLSHVDAQTIARAAHDIYAIERNVESPGFSLWGGKIAVTCVTTTVGE